MEDSVKTDVSEGAFLLHLYQLFHGDMTHDFSRATCADAGREEAIELAFLILKIGSDDSHKKSFL
jgi:hypothetical protein